MLISQSQSPLSTKTDKSLLMPSPMIGARAMSSTTLRRRTTSSWGPALRSWNQDRRPKMSQTYHPVKFLIPLTQLQDKAFRCVWVKNVYLNIFHFRDGTIATSKAWLFIDKTGEVLHYWWLMCFHHSILFFQTFS